MKDLRESMFIFLAQLAFAAILAAALAITAIAQSLPWIILAGSLGLCLIIVTVTGCILKLRRRSAPPVVYILQPGQSPQLADNQQAKQLLMTGQPVPYVIENPKALKRIGRQR
jgi:hypothetical protein